jgi:glucose/arabinose dehydrogenase
MTSPGTPHEPPRPFGPRTRRRALVFAGLIVAAVTIIGCASAPASDDEQAAQDTANRAAASAPAATTQATTTTPTTEATTAPAAPTKTTPAPILITDGTYTVGEDMPAGRYKVTERAGDACYWSRTRGDSDIIDNGLGGGFPSFTTKTGETVEISGCPEFRKVK